MGSGSIDDVSHTNVDEIEPALERTHQRCQFAFPPLGESGVIDLDEPLFEEARQHTSLHEYLVGLAPQCGLLLKRAGRGAHSTSLWRIFVACDSKAGNDSSTLPFVLRVMIVSSPASRVAAGVIQLNGSSTGMHRSLTAGRSLSIKCTARRVLTSEAKTCAPSGPVPSTF